MPIRCGGKTSRLKATKRRTKPKPKFRYANKGTLKSNYFLERVVFSDTPRPRTGTVFCSCVALFFCRRPYTEARKTRQKYRLKLISIIRYRDEGDDSDEEPSWPGAPLTTKEKDLLR